MRKTKEIMPSTSSPHRRHRLVIFPLLCLLLLLQHPTHIRADENHYCGTTWLIASQNCNKPCFSGEHSECTGATESCFGWTGCAEKLAAMTPEPTPKPTRRTKRPTAKPTTQEPTASAAPTRPSDAPSSSPIVRPQLINVETIHGDSKRYNGDKRESTILSTTSQRSYGIIFEVRTTEDAPAVSIAGLEFYSPVRNANLAYEVWTKSGTWHGFEGKYRKFTKMASGNLTTSSLERGLTRIPDERFVPIKVDGGGMRLSIYMTLTTKDLLYAHSTLEEEETSIKSIQQANAPTEDTIVLVQTPELIVYEGAAIMTYPFQKAAQRIFYRMPRGFVGRLWYLRDPCEDVTEIVRNETEDTERVEWKRVQKWEECRETKSPVPVPSVVPEMPSSFLGDDEDDGTNLFFALGNNTNGTYPTMSPTISSEPTIDMMKINLVLTFDNLKQNRILNREEKQIFEELTMEFYERQELLEWNEVELYGAKIWYQQVFVEEIEEEEGAGGTSTNGENRLDSRRLQENGTVVLQDTELLAELQDRLVDENIFDEPEEEGSVISLGGEEEGVTLTDTDTQTTQTAGEAEGSDSEEPAKPVRMYLEVTLILNVLYSPLPLQITQELLQTLLSNNERTYLQSLQSLYDHPTFFDYMRTLNGISSILAVDRVTDPPTRRPTSSPTPPVIVLEESPTMTPSMVAGTIIALIYAALTCTSMCYVKRARQRMRIENQKRKFGGNGVISANARVYHGMDYEYDKKSKKKLRSNSMNNSYTSGGGGGGDDIQKTSKKSEKKRLLRGFSKKLSPKNKNKKKFAQDGEQDDMMENGDYRNDNVDRMEQYNGSELHTLEEENEEDESYYSEESGSKDDGRGEDLSSMEDSYYSEDESESYSDSSGSR